MHPGSSAFKYVEMAWVAGVGQAVDAQLHVLLDGGAAAMVEQLCEVVVEPLGVQQSTRWYTCDQFASER